MTLLWILACKSATQVPTPTDSTDPPTPPCPALPSDLVVGEGGEGVWFDVVQSGSVTVSGAYGLDEDGATHLDLPGSFFLTGSGAGELVFDLDGCDLPVARLSSRRDPGLGAMLLADAPGHTTITSFPSGASPRVLLDPTRWPRLTGTVDVWLVDAGPGLPDGPLVDVRGAPDTVTVDGPTLVDLGPREEPVVTGLQVVVDLDRDGTFSSLDLRDTLWFYPPLDQPGPYTTTSADFSEAPYRTQRVFWPEGIDTFDTPRPVVVVAHGNGHEHTWYDALLQHLASWGYVAMAFACETEPGIEAATDSLLINTDLLLTRPGDIHPDLDGHLDVTRVAWIGHSRGGEAVVRGAQRLRLGTGSATLRVENLKLLSGMAPTVLLGPEVSRAGDRPLHLLLGGADGDITQGPITPGLPFRCDHCKSKRLLQGTTEARMVHYLQGAIHNDFNCCGFNDGFAVGADKIGRDAALAYQRAVYTALMGHYLAEEPGWQDLLERVPHAFPDTGLPVSVLMQPEPGRLRVIEDFQEQPDPGVASSGAAVVQALDGYVEGVLRDANITYTYAEDDPMNGMSESEGESGIAERGAVFSFENDVSWEVAIDPIQPDEATLAVRLAQSTRHPLTVGLDDVLTFDVTLVGSTETTLPSAGYALVNAPYPRGGAGQGLGWANEFVTVRIPLTDFETAGADLEAVTAVRLSFGPSHGSPQGRVAFDAVRMER